MILLQRLVCLALLAAGVAVIVYLRALPVQSPSGIITPVKIPKGTVTPGKNSLG